MTHDPMCPHPKCDYGSFNDNACHGFFECPHRCQCDLIAAVRAEMVQRVEVLGYYHDPILPKEHGYNEGREDAIEVLTKAVIGS